MLLRLPHVKPGLLVRMQRHTTSGDTGYEASGFFVRITTPQSPNAPNMDYDNAGEQKVTSISISRTYTGVTLSDADAYVAIILSVNQVFVKSLCEPCLDGRPVEAG